MKPTLPIIATLLGILPVMILSAVILTGCDKDSPIEPEGAPLLPDFDCREITPCALTCTDKTTGGSLPYVLRWQADQQATTSAANPTFIWNFAEITLVTVRLSVTDDDGDGVTRGPVEKSYEICGEDDGGNRHPTGEAT